jgi:adenylate kinase
MRIVLLGAPGSGKGTQAQRLIQRFGLPQISTGDLLRSAVARGTSFGVQARAAMDAGQLVSDDIVLGIIRERLAEPDVSRGYVLDGFPRNIAQARALSSMLQGIGAPLDAVVLLEVPYSEIIKRLAGRRTCPQCGAIYNIHDVPAGATLRCTQGADHPALVQRPDDNEATVTRRLEVYEQQTRPLIDHYAAQGLLRMIDANAAADMVTARLIGALLQPAPNMATMLKRAKEAKRKAPAKRKAAVKRKPVAKRKAAKRSAVKRSSKRPAKRAQKRLQKRVPKRPARRAAAKSRRPARKK